MQLKRTIVSRHVTGYRLNPDLVATHAMRAGDLAIFEVLEVGKPASVQMIDGRNRAIFSGDYLLATFADRYATSQFEGYVPDQPRPDATYQVLGAGGVVGLLRSKNAALEDIDPTSVRLVGYCCDEAGSVINTKFHNCERRRFRAQSPAPVILSIGSTMDSGKTTTAAFTARGLAKAGHRVGFIKLTGTCYTRDREFVADCGAHVVADFSDVGFPSTFMSSPAEILDIYQTLLDRFASERLDCIVMEIADGVMQRETMALLRDARFMQTIDRIVFSCGDSLSALHGVQLLREWGVSVAALSGRMTMSPLLIQEVESQLRIPVFTIEQAANGEVNHLLAGGTATPVLQPAA